MRLFRKQKLSIANLNGDMKMAAFSFISKAFLKFGCFIFKNHHWLKENNRDPLADKESRIRLGLNEMEFSDEGKKQGLNNLEFSEKDMGKTGDSRTGGGSEKHKKIVRNQVEEAKSMMLQRRMLEGKISAK